MYNLNEREAKEIFLLSRATRSNESHIYLGTLDGFIDVGIEQNYIII